MMRVIRVYYDATGPWGNWDDAIKAEFDRLNLTDSERKRTTVICTPESMRPIEKSRSYRAGNYERRGCWVMGTQGGIK
jgi:hypothetical protein